MPMMTLGQFVFGLDTVAYQEMQRATDWRHPSNSRVGARPARQYVGQGDDTITFTGLFVPEFRGGRKTLDELRKMADAGSAYAMVNGAGDNLGAWVIQRLSAASTSPWSWPAWTMPRPTPAAAPMAARAAVIGTMATSGIGGCDGGHREPGYGRLPAARLRTHHQRRQHHAQGGQAPDRIAPARKPRRRGGPAGSDPGRRRRPHGHPAQGRHHLHPPGLAA